MNKQFIDFPISLYGNVEPISDVLSKARCRIFYKYGNRNGTYITDEFAEELISTLPYVPVKGIYESDDYTDHGTRRSQGKIYGIVPENFNFAWEQHTDEDGVAREYACCDVYLFTALYKEAGDIIGKGQSMELFEPSLKYHRAVYNGIPYIVFDHGSFLGLQVLGDDVEPCFEGASFFSLQQSIRDTIQKIKEYSYVGGNAEMLMPNFKLSDGQKFDALWILLNPNYDEEHNYEVDRVIIDVYDEYAIAYNYEQAVYERVFYTKNDETESVEVTSIETVYVVYATEEEKKTIDTLRALNGDTYAQINEDLGSVSEYKNRELELNQQIVTLNTTIEEYTSQITTLNTECENLRAEFTTAQAATDQLNTEVESLRQYKLDVETQRKESVLAEYEGKLVDSILDQYRENFAEYTAEELDMHLAYELKKTDATVFNKKAEGGYIPKDNSDSMSGVERILSKYVKK